MKHGCKTNANTLHVKYGQHEPWVQEKLKYITNNNLNTLNNES